ncbi:VapC toxin family PIN domain ribonuclease [Limnobacter sp. YS8-69]|uniref:VapC toxin family PIN domain ribonuclease n=1 Tax=Limnobacter parvus TaxID=2939690 RepID=A0ABT1XCS7_9BURK|nr:VapC toxin family PIN domain ribonuclease [Limnobacter parvus]
MAAVKVLVDTTVWVDHFQQSEPQLVRLLNEGSVLGHPFVLGEMALANLQDRERVLIWMADLEPTVLASPTEVLELVELRELHGQGLGYVDTHLLASVLLSPGTTLWTRDMQLLRLVKELGLQPPIQDRFFMHDSVRQYTDDGKR